MDIDTFRRAAAEMLEEIPPGFQRGVDAVEVTEEAVPHPDVPDVYTLGECRTEAWPSGYDEGEFRSRLLLHYGSFRALAERDPAFDWTAELWETILHELLHHREWAAGEMSLDLLDWVVEQNHRRHAGLDFDPDFYSALPADEDGIVRVESEAFVEGRPPEGEDEEEPGDRALRFGWRGATLRVTPGRVAVPGGEPAGTGPAPEGEPTHLFVQVENVAGGRLWVVDRRPVPRWKRWLGLGALLERARPAEARGRASPAVGEGSDEQGPGTPP